MMTQSVHSSSTYCSSALDCVKPVFPVLTARELGLINLVNLWAVLITGRTDENLKAKLFLPQGLRESESVSTAS